ncbi:hypothetical protein M426DRAFT_134786 [Hypoxylon sp. CI-4A]|nr:hypothetical protein M426DRAFT_134786 [Hypoxylon sp. CI-4A]
MGFTTGFTGGVTLTLSIAYLTVLAHQRSREHQAAVLRQQTRLLSGIVDPLPPTLPPTRAEIAAAERANLIERAKDRWNSEVEGAVHWAQNKDWDEVREGVETAVSRLWARALGDTQDQVVQKGEDVVAKAQTEANGKLTHDKKQAEGVAAAAKTAYADAKAKGSEVATQTKEKAEESRGSFFSSIADGWKRSKEVAGKAKSAVVGKAEKKVDEVSSQLSTEEKVLNQRYQTQSGFDQSPEEVLAARYGQQEGNNNTQLKAL